MSETLNRKIDVEALSDEQLEEAIGKLSHKINHEVNKACENVNMFLSRYGLKCKMQLVIDKSDASDTIKIELNK